MTEAFLRDLVIRTLRDPRGAAAQILAMGLPMQARWLALGAVIALSAVLGSLAEIMFAFVTKIELGEGSPVPMAVAQGALLIYGAFAMTVVGRWCGGQGRFADALLLLVWMEFVLIRGAGGAGADDGVLPAVGGGRLGAAFGADVLAAGAIHRRAARVRTAVHGFGRGDRDIFRLGLAGGGGFC